MSDRFDDIFNEEDDQSNSDNNSSINSNQQVDVQVKPVKLSRLAVTGILIVGVIIVIILLLTIRGCSIEKVDKNINSNNATNSQSVSRQNNTENSEQSNDNFFEKSSIQEDVESKSVEESKVSELGQQSEFEEVSVINQGSNEGDSNNSNFIQVNEPVLSGNVESNGIVISKKVYIFNNSYIYGVVLSVIIDDYARNVEYFCPKKTYDALQSADIVKITYQYDSKGILSVTSLSK